MDTALENNWVNIYKELYQNGQVSKSVIDDLLKCHIISEREYEYILN